MPYSLAASSSQSDCFIAEFAHVRPAGARRAVDHLGEPERAVVDVDGNRYPLGLVGIASHVVDESAEVGVGRRVIDFAKSGRDCTRLLVHRGQPWRAHRCRQSLQRCR